MSRINLQFLFVAIVFSMGAFYFLKDQPALSVNFSVSTENVSEAQIFWRSSEVGFLEEKSKKFKVLKGWNNFSADIPNSTEFLRIDPASIEGKLTIHRIVLNYHSIPFYFWGWPVGFGKWRAQNQLTDFISNDGPLTMTSTGDDPSIESKNIKDVLGLKSFIDLILSGIIGFLGAAVQAGLPVSSWKKKNKSSHSFVISESQKSWILLGVVSCVCAGIVLVASNFILKPKPKPKRHLDLDDVYSQSLVDRTGRPLSEKYGAFKLILDPFTQYRNWPNQKTKYFSINSLGYRGKEISNDKRPKIILLGGSAAFGQNLLSDEDSLAMQLEKLNSKYSFINAAVIGFGSAQELGEMVHYSDSLRPEAYITLNGWNDYYIYLLWEGRGKNFGFSDGFMTELEDQLFNTVVEHSKREIEVKPVFAKFGRREKEEKFFESYVGNLQKMSAFAKARGSKFFVAFQPEIGARSKFVGEEGRRYQIWEHELTISGQEFTRGYQEFIAKAKAYCDAHGIPNLDLNSAPQIENHKEELFTDQVHLNALGTRIESELLNNSLQSMHFLSFF